MSSFGFPEARRGEEALRYTPAEFLYQILGQTEVQAAFQTIFQEQERKSLAIRNGEPIPEFGDLTYEQLREQVGEEEALRRMLERGMIPNDVPIETFGNITLQQLEAILDSLQLKAQPKTDGPIMNGASVILYWLNSGDSSTILGLFADQESIDKGRQLVAEVQLQ